MTCNKTSYHCAVLHCIQRIVNRAGPGLCFCVNRAALCRQGQSERECAFPVCASQARYGEIWGDMGRYGEIWGDMRLVVREPGGLPLPLHVDRGRLLEGGDHQRLPMGRGAGTRRGRVLAPLAAEEAARICRARCSGVGAGMYAAKRTARIAVTSERAFETLERGWSRRSPGSIDDRRALAFGCRASRLPLCVGGNLPPSSSSSETTWS